MENKEDKIYLLYRFFTENRYSEDGSETVVAASFEPEKLMKIAKEQIDLAHYSWLENKKENPDNISEKTFDDGIILYGRVSKLSYSVSTIKLI